MLPQQLGVVRLRRDVFHDCIPILTRLLLYEDTVWDTDSVSAGEDSAAAPAGGAPEKAAAVASRDAAPPAGAAADGGSSASAGAGGAGAGTSASSGDLPSAVHAESPDVKQRQCRFWCYFETPEEISLIVDKVLDPPA